MKTTSFILLGLLAAVATATYECPIETCHDAAALEFGYSIQKFLLTFYESIPLNSTFFDSLPTGSTVSPFNSQTLATNAVTNFAGLQNQASLSVQGLSDLGANTSSYTAPSCTYTYPPITNASTFIAAAFYIEATLCGAFIGLASYVQTPAAAFLMARLAADHGTHAAFLRTYTQATLFSAANKALVPAFTPATVLMPGKAVGNLGAYLGGCVPAPEAPCGETITVGPLNAVVSGGEGWEGWQEFWE